MISINAQSLYSFYGLGIPNTQGGVNNVGMGEVGIAVPQTFNVNIKNPANLVFNSMSMFNVSYEVEKRTTSTENSSSVNNTGNLKILTYTFPVMLGKWTSSFGLEPFTQVEYHTSVNKPTLNDTSTNTKFRQVGGGGLTHFFWSNGLVISPKLYVGIRMNYTFGTIERNSEIIVSSTGNLIKSSGNLLRKLKYSALNFQIGAATFFDLSEKKKLNLGVIFSPQSTFDGNEQILYNPIVGSQFIPYRIGLSNNSTNGITFFGFGVGLSYQVINRLLIGLDFETQHLGGATENSLKDGMKIALGLSYTPDFDNPTNKWKRLTYRVGTNYSQLPIQVEGNTLSDFGINMGVSVPIKGINSFDLSLKFGRTFSPSVKLANEGYIRMAVGMTMNDRWFVKQKYD